jgi:phenylacetate-CoA ligase
MTNLEMGEMTRGLRAAVEISPLSEGVQLTDKETGFAVELEPEYVPLLQEMGPAGDDFWKKLTEMGLVDIGLDLFEIRRRQRGQLRDSQPPLLERLQGRLADIRENVPFFRERSEDYSPERLTTLEDLTTLPFMRKRDLRTNFPNGLLPEGTDVAQGLHDRTLVLKTTSGATDDRLQVVSHSMIERHPFGCDDLYGVPIGGQQPRTAFFTTPVCAGDQCHLGQSIYEDRISKMSPDLFLNSTEDPFGIQPELIAAFCEEIDRFQPQILLADAIYLQCLIRRARELGKKLPRVPFIQYGFEFGHRAAVRDIKREFGVPVLNEYGATEENRIALECHRGSLHVRADAVHFEIVDAQGPCPPGVVGAVALTTFDSLMPLVRYLIGDAAAWTGKPCDCAFADWPTIELHGRLKDMIQAENRWVSTLDIDKAIGAPEWLDFYRVIQYGLERIEVQVIPALGATPDFKNLADRLSQHLNPKHIEFRAVARFDPLKSMKIGLAQNRLGGTPELP